MAKIKCCICKKKVSSVDTIAFACVCKKILCSKHRQPWDHKCTILNNETILKNNQDRLKKKLVRTNIKKMLDCI